MNRYPSTEITIRGKYYCIFVFHLYVLRLRLGLAAGLGVGEMAAYHNVLYALFYFETKLLHLNLISFK